MLLKKAYNMFNSTLNKLLLILVFFLFKFYKFFISPFLGSNCRFTPSCSSYAFECFQTFSFLKACKLSFIRIVRCHPWGGFGYDPVDKNKL